MAYRNENHMMIGRSVMKARLQRVNNENEKNICQAEIEPQQDTYTGLCINCSEAPNCRYRLAAVEPIVFCEEYQCASGEPDKSAHNMYVFNAAGNELDTSPLLRGLCVNCENKETCMLPKAEGGVWYCEEYE